VQSAGTVREKMKSSGAFFVADFWTQGVKLLMPGWSLFIKWCTVTNLLMLFEHDLKFNIGILFKIIAIL